jgi:hypothetical protein
VDPLTKFGKERPVEDGAASANLNNLYGTFETTCARWLPECRNLGAKVHTEYHINTGLTKDQQAKIIETLIGQKGFNDADRRYRVNKALASTELFEHFSFGALHGEVERLAGATSAFTGGFLSQIIIVKGLRPNATFCVYRGEGIDALAFYENDSLLFCLQYFLSSGNGPLRPSLPPFFPAASLVKCLPEVQKMCKKQREDLGVVGGEFDLPKLAFVPRNLVFCPVFGDIMLYKSVTESGDQAWKRLNLYELENRDALITLEYRKVFTNAFFFLNRERPVFAQNNKMLRPEDLDTTEGEAGAKWLGNTNVPDALLSWPIPGIPEGCPRNLLYVGKNYIGQLARGDHGGYIELFGVSDFVLPELLRLTAEQMKREAAERGYWDHYRQIMGGAETSAGRLGPQQRMENARKLLEYLNNGR